MVRDGFIGLTQMEPCHHLSPPCDTCCFHHRNSVQFIFVMRHGPMNVEVMLKCFNFFGICCERQITITINMILVTSVCDFRDALLF